MATTKPAPGITLCPLTSTNLREGIRCRIVAFEEAPLAKVLRPLGSTPELIDFMTERNQKTVGQPGEHYLIVTDDATGKTLAFAHWTKVDAVYRAATSAASDDYSEPATPTPFINKVAGDKFSESIKNAQSEIMGDKDYWTLNILVTYKEARGRGAGSALLKWGLDRADADGLPTYLDSTPPGKALYEKAGFKVVKELYFDLKPWGKDHVVTTWPMVRPLSVP